MAEPTLLIVPSMAHLALSVGKLTRLVEQYFGDGTFALVAVCGEWIRALTMVVLCSVFCGHWLDGNVRGPIMRSP